VNERMTRDDRRTPRDREQTQPDGLAARTREEAAADASSVDSSPTPQDSARKPFNPWRFGFHTVSPDHRRELLEMELPETPPERLFDANALGGKSETSTSAPPALTVDASDKPSGNDDPSRKADTLRLRRGPPPAQQPLRRATAWAAIAAVAVIGVLWLLFGGVTPSPSAPATVAKPSTPPQAHAAAHAPARATAVPTNTTPGRPDTAASTSVAAPASSANTRPRISPPPAGQPVGKPARTTDEPKVPAETRPAAPSKPKGAAPDDDASPFGHWTAPPRDN
jgi:hypothetical protein